MTILRPDEETRNVIEFWLKITVGIVALVGGVWFGVKHLNKFDAEQTIIAKLVGDHTMAVIGENGSIFQADGSEYCRISGRYNVKNVGSYGFYADEVTFTLWEVPYLDQEVAGEETVRFAISNRIDNQDGPHPARMIDQEVISVRENFAPQNELQRSFGFIFAINKQLGAVERRYDSFYVVEANTTAALKPNEDGSASNCTEKKGGFGNLLADIGDPGVCFNENDLRHLSETLLCIDPVN